MHCTLSLLPARSHSVSLLLIYRSQATTILPGQDDNMILLRDRLSDSLWRRECIGDCTDITFPLLTYLSSFLYRFSNLVTLMVMLRTEV